MNTEIVFNGTIYSYKDTDGDVIFSKVTDWRYGKSTGIVGNFVHTNIRKTEIVNGVI